MNDEVEVGARASAEISHKQVVKIARIETDQFPICITKVERKRHRLFGQKIIYCHRDENGFDIKIV